MGKGETFPSKIFLRNPIKTHTSSLWRPWKVVKNLRSFLMLSILFFNVALWSRVGWVVIRKYSSSSNDLSRIKISHSRMILTEIHAMQTKHYIKTNKLSHSEITMSTLKRRKREEMLEMILFPWLEDTHPCCESGEERYGGKLLIRQSMMCEAKPDENRFSHTKHFLNSQITSCVCASDGGGYHKTVNLMDHRNFELWCEALTCSSSRTADERESLWRW